MKPVGDGTRILNFLVDTTISFIIAYYSYKAWNWYVMYWGYTHYNFGWFFFGSIFIYYTFFEAIFSRTPGKWFSFSKVVNVKGRRVSLWRVILRSLARITIIDIFFIPFIGKPLHDFISGTTVIEA